MVRLTISYADTLGQLAIWPARNYVEQLEYSRVMTRAYRDFIRKEGGNRLGLARIVHDGSLRSSNVVRDV